MVLGGGGFLWVCMASVVVALRLGLDFGGAV